MWALIPSMLSVFDAGALTPPKSSLHDVVCLSAYLSIALTALLIHSSPSDPSQCLLESVFLPELAEEMSDVCPKEVFIGLCIGQSISILCQVCWLVFCLFLFVCQLDISQSHLGRRNLD